MLFRRLRMYFVFVLRFNESTRVVFYFQIRSYETRTKRMNIETNRTNTMNKDTMLLVQWLLIRSLRKEKSLDENWFVLSSAIATVQTKRWWLVRSFFSSFLASKQKRVVQRIIALYKQLSRLTLIFLPRWISCLLRFFISTSRTSFEWKMKCDKSEENEENALILSAERSFMF